MYPKSWAPFKAMEERSALYVKGDQKGIDELEKRLLAQNAEHKDWACTEEKPQPKALIMVLISAFFKTLSIEAFSTFKILPRIGMIA